MMGLPHHLHNKWEIAPTAEIQKYLKKYSGSSIVPGKCSTRRRKKIKFLQSILQRREKALRLISGLHD